MTHMVVVQHTVYLFDILHLFIFNREIHNSLLEGEWKELCIKYQNVEECDLVDFDLGMFGGARQVGVAT